MNIILQVGSRSRYGLGSPLPQAGIPNHLREFADPFRQGSNEVEPGACGQLASLGRAGSTGSKLLQASSQVTTLYGLNLKDFQ